MIFLSANAMQQKNPQSTDACYVFMRSIIAKKEGILTHEKNCCYFSE
jgi:hypothetical protein